jgi:hypothetical protein
METASNWIHTPAIRRTPVAPSAADVTSDGDRLTRLRRALSRVCSAAFGARGRYRAAEGASDVELARLARTGARLRFDDVRWQNMRTLRSGVRHV